MTQQSTASGAELTEASRLAGRAADHVQWYSESLRQLPDGAAELALMAFQNMVGSDPAGAREQVLALQARLQAMADGEPDAPTKFLEEFPGHRSRLEGLLAFGEAASDEEAVRRMPDVEALGGVPDEAARKVLDDQMTTVRRDLTDLLTLLEAAAGRS
jgi:hypothetical protein